MGFAVFVHDFAIAANDAAIVIPEDELAGIFNSKFENDVKATHLSTRTRGMKTQTMTENLAPVERPAVMPLDDSSVRLRELRHQRRVPLRFGDPAPLGLLDRAGPGTRKKIKSHLAHPPVRNHMLPRVVSTRVGLGLFDCLLRILFAGDHCDQGIGIGLNRIHGRQDCVADQRLRQLDILKANA